MQRQAGDKVPALFFVCCGERHLALSEHKGPNLLSHSEPLHPLQCWPLLGVSLHAFLPLWSHFRRVCSHFNTKTYCQRGDVPGSSANSRRTEIDSFGADIAEYLGKVTLLCLQALCMSVLVSLPSKYPPLSESVFVFILPSSPCSLGT